MQDDYSNVWIYRAKWAYVLAIVGALMAPVFYIIYISFNEHGFGARIYEFTFDWYRVVLTDTILVSSIRWTVYLALATIGVVVPMALMAAKFYRHTRHKVGFVALMLFPLFIPADIMASALLVHFKVLNQVFSTLGEALGAEWLSSWFELGFTTALIGLVLYTIPYAFVVILITMSRYREQQTEAARSCGATAWQAFWHVEFPQIRVGVFSSCAFVTILTFNETQRTAMLKGGFDTFSNVLVSQMMNVGMSEESYAMAGITSMLSMLIIGSILIYTYLRAELLQREQRAKAQPVMST